MLALPCARAKNNDPIEVDSSSKEEPVFPKKVVSAGPSKRSSPRDIGRALPHIKGAKSVTPVAREKEKVGCDIPGTETKK